MKPMADLFRFPRKTGLRILVLVVSLLCAVLMAFDPYTLDIFSSSSSSSAAALLTRFWLSLRSWLVPTNIFIAINIIIMVIWLLSEKREHKEDKPEEEKTSADAAAQGKDPGCKPEPEVWHDIPRRQPPGSRGDPAESGAKAPPERSSDSESCVTAGEEEEEDDASSRDCDSMEATWNAIMEGGASPVRRYLTQGGAWVEGGRRLERAAGVGGKEMRKSQTFKEVAAAAASGGGKEMRKSQTFKEAGAPPPPQPDMGWRRREALVTGQDELYLRFEEFIKKTYEQLRLQRQLSRQRYMEMVNKAY